MAGHANHLVVLEEGEHRELGCVVLFGGDPCQDVEYRDEDLVVVGADGDQHDLQRVVHLLPVDHFHYLAALLRQLASVIPHHKTPLLSRSSRVFSSGTASSTSTGTNCSG
jgi:hypothetical protein